MKWLSKSKSNPKEGDIKEKTKFSLFPTKIKDTWVWLERYSIVYEYKKSVIFDNGMLISNGTVFGLRWCRIDTKIKDGKNKI